MPSSPAGSITTPARSTKPSSTPCPTWAASAPAAGTTTWRRSTPISSSPASALRWVWIACWPAWKSWACCRKCRTPAEIFIPYFDAARLHDYLRLAAQLRAAGFGVEVFPEPKKLGQQLKYADRRGFRVAIVAGENEFAAGNVQVKNLATDHQRNRPADRRRNRTDQLHSRYPYFVNLSSVKRREPLFGLSRFDEAASMRLLVLWEKTFRDCLHRQRECRKSFRVSDQPTRRPAEAFELRLRANSSFTFGWVALPEFARRLFRN